VSAHLLAAGRAPALGFGRYIVSASTPFRPEDLAELNVDAPRVVARRVPGYRAVYHALGFRMFDRIERVYVNEAARRDLGWVPGFDFARVVRGLGEGSWPVSPISRLVGSKGYHDEVFEDGPYPVHE
jgi:UDP-glucose 4-epimerase